MLEWENKNRKKGIPSFIKHTRLIPGYFHLLWVNFPKSLKMSGTDIF